MSSAEQTPVSTPHTTPTKPPPLMTLSSDTPPTTPPFSLISPLPPRRTVSSSTTVSTSSTSSARSRGDVAARRRGFMRPQGTEFSTSAKSRESVMALGSIAHLQYFFAKTGLLDGKGGGLQKKKSSKNLIIDTTTLPQDSTYSSLRSSPEPLFPHEHEYFSDSPTDDMDEFILDQSLMLPPTTSTYNPQTKQLPPAPDPEVVRTQLRGALSVTQRAWEQSPLVNGPPPEKADGRKLEEKKLPPLPEGFQELEGTELVDLATSAIRAARAYYFTTDISLLSKKDEKTLREEFMAILDVLKRMAQRKFHGGVKVEERDALVKWVHSVEVSLDEEERAIAEIRSKGREWLEGDWEGRHMERCHLFLSYFDSTSEPLPKYDPLATSLTLPTSFLGALRSGLRLILIHNAIIRRSKRPFGQIPTYHTEFSKSYRSAENLRYWKKAAEIRWELKLKFDVMAVVNGTPAGWKDFERDIGLWCGRVLDEVRQDWKMGVGAAVVGTEAAGVDGGGGGITVREKRSATLESLRVEVGDD